MTQTAQVQLASNVKGAFEKVVSAINALKTSTGDKFIQLGERMTNAENAHTTLSNEVNKFKQNNAAEHTEMKAEITALEERVQKIEEFLGTTNGEELGNIMAQLQEQEDEKWLN